MMATIWIHRSCGSDLLVEIPTCQAIHFTTQLIETGEDQMVFKEKPLYNYKVYDQGTKLVLPEEEIDIFSFSDLQVLVAHEGFLPPKHMYDKIFQVTPEAAIHILTGLPWSNFTKEEILAEMDPHLHPAVEKGDGFSREILKATMAHMEPKMINIESMEHYIFLVTAPGGRFSLRSREEPYDLREPWKTVEQLDAELEKYMSTA